MLIFTHNTLKSFILILFLAVFFELAHYDLHGGIKYSSKTNWKIRKKWHLQMFQRAYIFNFLDAVITLKESKWYCVKESGYIYNTVS